MLVAEILGLHDLTKDIQVKLFVIAEDFYRYIFLLLSAWKFVSLLCFSVWLIKKHNGPCYELIAVLRTTVKLPKITISVKLCSLLIDGKNVF